LGTVKNDTYSMMVNRSLNQVLMRSLNTSFVAVLPVFSLLVVGRFALGAVGLQDFALALFVGLLSGAYSSIYVATPIVAWLKEREPKYRAVRERSRSQMLREQSSTAGPTRSGAAGAPATPPTDRMAAPSSSSVAVAVADAAGVDDAGDLELVDPVSAPPFES